MLYDIQLPHVKTSETADRRATFVIEPLYSGYGMTLGNSLRRVLLSSLGGAAVTAVKINNASHEFSTLDGVKEDLVDIILNLKRLRFKVYSTEPQLLFLSKSGKGQVTAADIKTTSEVEVVNPKQSIATIDNNKAKLTMEIRVEQGRGYVPVESREHEKLEVGMIAVDAIYSPVTRVRYNVENTRVGQVTDLDRLVMEIETDGTVTPEDAFKQAAEILVDHFGVITGQPAASRINGEAPVGRESEAADIMVEELNLSSRTTNALLNNDIKSVKDLLELDEAKLRDLKGFGAKAYDEVTEKLAELGYAPTASEKGKE